MTSSLLLTAEEALDHEGLLVAAQTRSRKARTAGKAQLPVRFLGKDCRLVLDGNRSEYANHADDARENG